MTLIHRYSQCKKTILHKIETSIYIVDTTTENFVLCNKSLGTNSYGMKVWRFSIFHNFPQALGLAGMSEDQNIKM